MVRTMRSSKVRVVLRLRIPGSLIRSTPWRKTIAWFRCKAKDWVIQWSNAHFGESMNVMHIKTHKVSQTMWHECGCQMHLHHIIHIPLEQPKFFQFLEQNSFRQAMHVGPGNPCGQRSKVKQVQWQMGKFCVVFWPGLTAAMTARFDLSTAL